MTFEQLLALLVALLLFASMVRRLGRRMEPKTPAETERQARELPPPVRARPPILTPEGTWRRARPPRAPVPTPTPAPPARRRAGFRLGSLPEARRGIVLMTVLAPCRALEPWGPPGHAR